MFILLLSIRLINAQDIITKIDSSKFQTIILEISPKQIKCKLFNYTDSPEITVSKTQIAYIVLKNGKTIRYPEPIIRYDRWEEQPNDSMYKKLYLYKNYLGLNWIVLLNNTIGFNYMREIKNAHLTINIPIAIGFNSPNITNALQKTFHHVEQGELIFRKINFQVGLSTLYMPLMRKSTNFLIGPSFLFTSYNVSSELYYNIRQSNYLIDYEVYKNDFEIRRQNYGITIGFIKRFNERFNLSLQFTVGTVIDTYNKKDPFGLDIIKSVNGTYSPYSPFINLKTDTYDNLNWSFGYRF